MKELTRNFDRMPRLFWLKRRKDGKFYKKGYGHSLSVNAKWVFMTLKELENSFTGKENNEETLFWEGVRNTKDWFYCSNEDLALECNLSVSTVKRAKIELEASKLISTCRVYKVKPDGTKSQHWLCGYYIHDGLTWEDLPYNKDEK